MNILAWFESVDSIESIITIISGCLLAIGTAIKLCWKNIKEILDKGKKDIKEKLNKDE